MSYREQNEGTAATTTGSSLTVASEFMDFIMPRRHSDDQLKESLAHIYHEMNQFFHSYLYLQDVITFRDTSMYDSFLHDALLECFLIHYRALICFFPNNSGNKVHKDDVLSVHYGFTQPVTVTESVWERLNKDIAHLSYQRNSRNPDEKWYIDSIAVAMVEICRSFWNHLNAWFNNELPEIQMLFDTMRRVSAIAVQYKTSPVAMAG